MKNLNLFSDLWSSVAGSRKDNGSTRLRVWPLKLVSVLAILLTLGIGNAWGATDAVFSFALAKDNPGNEKEWTTDDIDAYSYWTATKGGSNAPKYYDTGYGLRIYNGGSFTITSTRTISSITLTFSGTSSTFSTSNTTNPQTVTPNAKSYTWDVSRTCRLQGVEITYSDGGVAGDYELLTDVSDLDPGDKIIILNTGNTYAISTTQNANNRGQSTDFTKAGSGQATVITLEESTTVQVLGISESGASNHGFYALNGSSNGFLYATSSSNNYMGTRAFGATPTDGNGSWNITLNSGSGYEAVIAAQGDKTRNLLKYNSSSSLFSCYASGQTAVKIYRKIRPCTFVDVSDGSTVILPKGVADYSTGDWKKKGAPDAYAAVAEHNVNGYCVTFTQAADYNHANGLQLQASAGTVTISGIKSTAGVDVDVVIEYGTGISVALTGADTKTGQSAGTTTITTYSTTADLTISKTTSGAGYIKTITIRPRSCNDEVTLSGGSPSHGTVTFSPSGSIGTCAGVVSTTMTITPATGYYLSAYSKSGVNTSNSPSIATSGSTSEAAQNINLAFAEHTDGTYTANATFSQIMVNSLTLRAQQTDQSDKVGNNITMTCYPKEGQTGGNDPLNHTLNLGLGAVLPANALDKTYSWTVRVKENGDADWTNVGFDGNVLNSNSIINSFNKNTGHLQIKATLGTAEFTITANDGSGVSAKATITVASVPVTGVSVEPTEMEVYAGQKKPVTITFAPLNATNKSYTTGSYSYVTMRSSGINPFYIEGNATDVVRNETVTVTTTDGSFTADVNVTVNPLPKVYFVDIVHDKTDFSGIPATGILVATVSADGLSVTTTQNTPTHSDLSTPAVGNACKKSHLHLVGWILQDWADEHPGANTSEISGAGSGYFYAPNVPVDLVSENGKTFYAVWAKQVDAVYTDYVFSCAELTLEPHLVTAGTPIFITSTANKKVRSQDSIHIEGSGLSASQTLTFPDLPSVFEVKTGAYGNIVTESDGTIDTYAYIFYTPAAGSTTDGLDKITGITVSVGGTKPITKTLTKDIIGRHLPADFVIAAKNTNDKKWYALPANFSTESNPTPVEIAVDDIDNPSTAYTTNTNIYNLYGQSNGAGFLEEAGQYVKLGMKNNSNYPLFGYAGAKTTIKGDADAIVTNNIGNDYWWLLTQTNTSITNPQDAKYTIGSGNNAKTLSAWFNATPQKWGLFAAGNGEHTLRLIPASSIVFTEAAVVEWSQNGAILEVDATATTGIDATSVIAHLNGASSSAITLSETKTSVNGSATKYNYTVNFGIGIDFAAAASNGAMMTLEWKKGETVKAMSNIVVPKIIATSTSMSSLIATDDPWNTADVHVLPGVTLTANAGDFLSKDVVVDRLEIYPGATVIVTKGAQDIGTLKVRTLVLRNGWTRIGEKTYDVARLYVSSDANLAKNANENVWYTDWYIDFDQYYPIAVPWTVTTSEMTYKNTSSAASAGVRMRYYDGASRASNVQSGVGESENWKVYDVGGKAYPATLAPGTGYAMTAKRPTGKAFSIVRMPLTIPSADWTTGGEKGAVSSTHKDQVSVTAHGNEDTPVYAKGWNFIANPYMSLYKGALSYANSETVEYANIPDENFKEFDQQPILTTKLKPSSAFLIQAPATGVVTFATENRSKASAPQRYSNEASENEMQTQRAYILLGDDQTEDMMGILVSEKYTADYELNADLEKLLSDGNTLRTYMRYNDMNMAYLAINEELAKQLIPVCVRIPADGEYTFRIHEASIADELEGIYLTDYQTGTTTNLLYDSYTFNAVAGTDNVRFAINAVIGKREVPTGVDISGSDKDRPTKFIWNDKVYILHNNVIYDSTGKRVNVINK